MRFSKTIVIAGLSILLIILISAVVAAVLIIPDINDDGNDPSNEEIEELEISNIKFKPENPGFNEEVTITVDIKGNWRGERESTDDPGETEVVGGRIYYKKISSGSSGGGSFPLTLIDGDTFSAILETYDSDCIINFFISAQTEPILVDPDDLGSYTYEEKRSDWMTIVTKDTALVEDGIVFNDIVEEMDVPDDRYVKFSFDISEPQNIEEVYFEHHHGNGGGGGGPLSMNEENIYWETYEKEEDFDENHLEYTIIVLTEDGHFYTTDYFMLDKNQE